MRKIREVLRLRWENRCSSRQIAGSCGISRSTVEDYLHRAVRAGLSWPLTPELDDTALEILLFPSSSPVLLALEKRHYPSLEELHRELARPNMTLKLLWEEYKQAHPDGYGYCQFCLLYRRWAGKLDVTMHQHHRAGEKMFVDYAGETMPVIDPRTGEIREASIFVASLGASSYTYAEASFSQDLPSWISAHVRAFRFFAGVPEILVPDNLWSGVTHPCRYEPDINKTYLDMAQHYGIAVIPARVHKPRDKAKVEVAVQIVQRWIVAALRNHTFFSLAELNRSIAERLQDLNNRPLQQMKVSRRELYQTLDKPALKALPSSPYEYAQWSTAGVNIDYHIVVDSHFYSVPYQLAKERVEVRLTDSMVEVLFKNRRVAAHPRSREKGRYTTLLEHMPKAHQKYLEWSPSRITRWAEQNGPQTKQLVTLILESKPHPEQGYRSCLGIIRLAKTYSPERLEAACARAVQVGARSYKSVKSILSNGLDQSTLPGLSCQATSIQHENVRGKGYFSQEAPHA